MVVASLVMYFPLHILQIGNIKRGGIGFGDPKLSAPQAGLMAALAQGIVGGEMAWPLVVAGVMFGVVDDHVQGDEPDAGGDRDVSAVPDHVRDFRRRRAALAHGLAQPRRRATTKRSGRASRTWAFWSPAD